MTLLRRSGCLLFVAALAKLCFLCDSKDKSYSRNLRALASENATWRNEGRGNSNGSQGNGNGRFVDCSQNPDSLAGCIRFSKITENRSITNPSYPLGRDQYPLSSVAASNVKQTDAVSVVDTEQEFFLWEKDELTLWAGGPPSYPTCRENDYEFWNEMREVLEVQMIRKEFGDIRGGSCKVMPLPNLWREKSLNDASEAVHDEYPGLHQANLIVEIMGGTYGDVIFDEEVLSSYSNRFIRGIVMLAHLNTWAVSSVGDYNFFLKWTYGRPRPEEVLYRLLKAYKLDDDDNCRRNKLPDDVEILERQFGVDPTGKDEIEGIAEATRFTDYPEGSPKHPSWPAMHSAASSIGTLLAVVLDERSPAYDAVVEQGMLTDYVVAYSRTVAGVHYPDDNVAGLRLGQKILANMLPDKLSSGQYPGDRVKISEKIDRVLANAGNWDTFFERHGIVNNVGKPNKNDYQNVKNQCGNN